MASAADLVIKITTDASQAQKGLDTTASKAGRMRAGIQKAALPATAALAAVGAAAISAGKAAAEDAQSQALLANSMKKSTGATDAQVAATEAAIAKMSMASGVADDQLRPAMGTLVRATGSAEKSQAALASALDISAATGKDVESVSSALAKGYAGNTSALGRLVPGIDKAVLATGDMDAIMAELARTTGGASAAAADTAAGKMQRMQVAMDEAKESVGAALLPAMSKLADVLARVATFVQNNSTAVGIAVGVIAALAAAILIANAAIAIYTTVTTLAGIASGIAWLAALGPILLVIAAVALVVGVIVLLWKKCEGFRTVVLAVWGAIKTATAAVVGWLKSAWAVVFAALSAYVRAYAAVFRAVFTAVKAVATVVANVVKAIWRVLFAAIGAYVTAWRAVIVAVFNGVKATVSAVAGAVKRVWESVFSALKRAASSIGSALSGPFDVVKRAVDAVVGAVRDLIGWLGRIKVPKISLPSFLGGGSSRAAAGLAAPAVMSADARMMATAAATPMAAPGSRATGGVVVNIFGPIDADSTARAIKRVLSSHDRRVGLAGPGLRTGTV